MNCKAAPMLLILWLMLSVPAWGAEMNLTADYIDEIEGIYTARGNVRVEREDAVLKADEMTHDRKTGKVSLKGNVSYEDPEITIKAESGDFDFEDDTGTLYEAYAFIKKDNYHIKARELRRLSRWRYRLKKASFTTCDAPKSQGLVAWCIRSRDADIIVGDRAALKHASLSVKGVPVLYAPYIWAPVLIERKTGLLLPDAGYSSTKGGYWRQPFFWAISENRDATFYLDVYTKRGLGQALEYRYIERPDLKGRAYVSHQRDRKLHTDFWTLRAAHEQKSGFFNLNLLNRRQYFRLYEVKHEESSRRFLESNFEVRAPLKGSMLYLRGNHYTELKEGISQKTVLQRLPEAGFIFYPEGARSPLTVSFNAGATNFTRQDGPSGQRLAIGFRAWHTAGKSLRLSQSVGLGEALYHIESTGGGDNRETLDYTASVSTALRRRYRGFAHAIEPSAGYTYAHQSRGDLPVFDSTELGLNRHSLKLSLVNRLRSEKREFLTLQAVEDFDMEGGSTLRLGLQAQPPGLRADMTYDTGEGALRDASSELSTELYGVGLSAGIQYARAGDLTTAGFGLLANPGALSLEGRLWYDLKEGHMRNLTAGIGYQRQCWAVALTYVKKPEDYSWYLSVTLKGIGVVKAH